MGNTLPLADRLPTGPVLELIRELRRLDGGTSGGIGSKGTSADRFARRLKVQEWCSLDAVDRVVVGHYGRPDLLIQLLDELETNGVVSDTDVVIAELLEHCGSRSATRPSRTRVSFAGNGQTTLLLVAA